MISTDFPVLQAALYALLFIIGFIGLLAHHIMKDKE